MTLSQPEHSPGGRRAWPLLKGCRGDAKFYGEFGEYRLFLTRDWTRTTPAKRFLWVGMNPSVAASNVDDPTIRKELKFTVREGGDSYVKCNVMDYRMTNPRRLLAVKKPCSDKNLETIMQQAKRSHVIVLAWGLLYRDFLCYANEAFEALRSVDKPLYCLGCTSTGDPRHPLYVDGNEKLQLYYG